MPLRCLKPSILSMWCPVQVAVAATVDTDTSGAVDGMDVRRPADGSI
jgi:hypothetical protein